MRDLGQESTGGAVAVLPSLAQVREWTRRLGASPEGLGDAERIDLIRSLEELKCAAAGAQAEVAADLDASLRRRAARAGEPAERQGRGIAEQVALARRESPHRGRQHLGLAVMLRKEMPCTREALRMGRISEWRATLLARETACVSRADRAEIDRRIAGDPDRLASMGDGQLVATARALAAELDPASVAERRRRAEADRRVSLRAAPDVMSALTALLPVKDGVAVWAVLSREADRRKATGDARTRGQIMADTLVSRVLRQADPESDGVSSPVPLLINVTVSDSVLLGDDDGCGWVEHYGPVPGSLLREWIAANAEDGVDQWVRRLYVTPSRGALVTMDSTARLFEGRLADYLRLRDRRCRTPYCDAPVRHLDHPEDYASGGVTSAHNAQGLCQGCNHAKQARGWSARPRPGPRHTIETVTPTGHRYTSTAPRLPVAERGLRLVLDAFVLDLEASTDN
jgi:hypothetical protein